jgi:hypothetical protein
MGGRSRAPVRRNCSANGRGGGGQVARKVRLAGRTSSWNTWLYGPRQASCIRLRLYSYPARSTLLLRTDGAMRTATQNTRPSAALVA